MQASGSSRVTASLLSCLALALCFWGFWQLDLPLARFLRSIHHVGLEQVGNVGNRLGSGLGLVLISGTMAAVGFALKHESVRQAGLMGLAAHGSTAIVTQVLKHVIGRPRPRLMHNGTAQFGPSFETGLDSFPSGHTAASFAVAVVVAGRFPRLAWPVYGAACLVAVSRVLRGSHFPTDVAAGVVLGVLVGSVAAHSIRDWRRSVVEGVRAPIPYLAGILSLLWVALHPLSQDGIALALKGAGWIAIGAGLFGRWRLLSGRPVSTMRLSDTLRLCGFGLALSTGSCFVTVLAFLLVWATKIQACEDPSSVPDSAGLAPLNPRLVTMEATVAVGVVAAAVVLQAVTGLLPIM